MPCQSTELFKPTSSTSSSETAPSTVSAEKQSTIELHLEKSSATKAEIISTLKSVMSGYSARSNEDMKETLASIFPELEATKSFQMSRSKSMCVVNHGLAPYFKSLLKTNLHKADFLVYSFDESLSDVTQTTEMDLHVRYWDSIESRVKVRYYDSTFLGCGTHKDLLNHFKSITSDLPSNKVYQVSMDGPNVNLKFYKEFSRLYKEENCHCLIDVGTCSFHTVHNWG